jgi:hypothetical protein
VSCDELDDLLTRIVASAASAVPAPSYVLAIAAQPSAPERIYAEGLDQSDTARIGAADSIWRQTIRLCANG